MSDITTPEGRLAQFQQLYLEVLNQEVNTDEFATDILYAFKILENASHSSSEELRNLAAHLALELETGVETINIRPLEPEATLTITRKMQQLTANAEAAVGQQTGERRQATTVLTPEMAKMIERLLRFYAAEFGRTFDLEEFLSNDLYGRAVLKKSQSSNNPELLATAEYFFDEEGRPKRHRRRGSREVPAP